MADTIKEFLVGLGFKVDADGLRKFNAGIADSTKAAINLGAKVTAAAIAVEVAVAKIAEKLEDLYYASQRTNATVENIEALEYAASQVGSSARGARSAIEGLARAMRLNPGTEGLINSLGVQTRDLDTGKLRDTSAILRDLVGQFRTMPFYIQAKFAEMLGISPDDLLQMENNIGVLDQAIDEHKRKVAELGVNEDQAAEQAVGFMRALRSLGDTVWILSERFGSALMPAGEKVLKWAEQGLEWFAKLDTKTNDWTATILSLVEAFRTLGSAVWDIIGSTATDSFNAFLTTMNNGLKTMLTLVRMVTHAIKGEWSQAWDDAKGIAGLGIDTLAATATTAVGIGGRLAHGIANSDTVKQAMEFFQNHGWSKDQAAGIVANLHKESGLNPNASGDGGLAWGIAQWHPDRQKEFAKWFGRDPKESTFWDQMAFVQYELTDGAEKMAGGLLRKAKDAFSAGGIVSRFYERPADTIGEMAARGKAALGLVGGPALAPAPAMAGIGGANVTMHQKTDIHVQGGGNADVTARRVADEQGRVNSELTRNMRSAVE